MNRKMKPMTWEEKLTDSRYQPTKDEMEEDVCINTTPETLADAVMNRHEPYEEEPPN